MGALESNLQLDNDSRLMVAGLLLLSLPEGKTYKNWRKT